MSNQYFNWLDGLGYYGVISFFVISGFVLPFSLGNNYQIGNYRKFLLRRFIRIEPTYITSILISSVTITTLTILAPNADIWFPSIKQFFLHFFYLIPFSKESWILPVYWTLAIEFQFYIIIGLIYPLFTRLIKNHKGFIVLIPILFSALIFVFPFFSELGILKYSPYFSVGLFLSFVYKRKLSILATLMVLSIIGLINLQLENDLIAYPVALITFFLILLWKPKTLQQNKIGILLLFFGTISYSWYVSHQLVASVGETLARFINNSSFLSNPKFLANIVPIVSFFCSILFAWLLYRVIEKPSQNLSKSLKYK